MLFHLILGIMITLDIPTDSIQAGTVFLSDYLESLADEIIIPTIDHEFIDSCSLAKAANEMKDEADRKVQELEKAKPVDQEALDLAKKELQDAQNLLDKELLECQDRATRTLANIQDFLSPSYDDKSLLLWKIINAGKPKSLVEWIMQDPDTRQDQMDRLLHDPALQRQFLEAGGAAGGKYGRCMEIYERLEEQLKDNPLLRRLATAVSLAHAHGICEFKTENLLDPVSRYVHYEQAYLLGELDPYFATFSAWELCHVVDNDATDEVIGWGRRSLMNYHPDQVLDEAEGSVWQYCRVVRTEVGYRQPDWWSQPVTYEQILSGGGECGPRAWYGRFICKAFGIPTWGVRQPGHAAMSRWTKDGWVTCLGAGFPNSWWENVRGNDFYLQTLARDAVSSDEEYMRKVLRLEWFAEIQREDYNLVGDGLPDPNSPLYSLSLMQRKILSLHGSIRKRHIPSKIHSKIVTLRALSCEAESIRLASEGKYVIPACSCTSPSTPTKDILFLKSFLGGQQLLIQGQAEVVYTFGLFIVPRTLTKFRLSFLISTVHRYDNPLSIVLTIPSLSESRTYCVQLPYTMGEWIETEPIEVEFGGPNIEEVLLAFSRKSKDFGIAMKSFTLERVD